MDYKVLIVDDDKLLIKSLHVTLGEEFDLIEASSGKEAVELVRSRDDIACVVMDIKMPGMDGIQATRAIRVINAELPVILFTAYAGEYSEAEFNSYGFVGKDEDPRRLLDTVRKAYNYYVTISDPERLSELAEEQWGLVGKTDCMLSIYRQLYTFGSTDECVLIIGERGTEIEFAAAALHKASERSDKPFVIMDCSSIVRERFQVDLFGQVVNSTDSSHQTLPGKLDAADGGTLFIDEIDSLAPDNQGALLRVIRSGEYTPVGLHEPKRCDVRFVFATRRDLGALVRMGKFREDLWGFFERYVIELPPLRNRKEDIPLLVDKFVQDFSAKYVERDFDKPAVELLTLHNWRGNLSELRTFVRAICFQSHSTMIMSHDVKLALGYISKESAEAVKNHSERLALGQMLDEYERFLIREALYETAGNVNAAADILWLDPSNLRKKIKKYGIERGKFDTGEEV